MSASGEHRLHVAGPDDQWIPVEGCRITSWSLERPAIDGTTIADGGWHRLLSDAGLRTLTVQADGLVLTDGSAALLFDLAEQPSAARMSVALAPGLRLIGKFLTTAIKVEAFTDEETRFALTLASSGPITRS